MRIGAASLRVLENSGRLKVKREGGQVAMPFERYGPGGEMAAGRRGLVGVIGHHSSLKKIVTKTLLSPSFRKVMKLVEKV